ncbi:hypothetical protein E2C01_072101 [Portunus trituberculatus]|uniref:Uncharacterized protein n=1 Tax=Portunus trituberculatus TaxID=210409 RepID=A0A5B7I1R5_PORTR|nr:hypothetical protein [Portunus trituberculatus]
MTGVERVVKGMPSNKVVATFSKDFLSVLPGYELALETHVTAHQRKGAAGLVTLVAAAWKWMHACVAWLEFKLLVCFPIGVKYWVFGCLVCVIVCSN